MNDRLNRRRFLEASTGALAAVLWPGRVLHGAGDAPAGSVVVQMRSDNVIVERHVSVQVLNDMMDRALLALTGAANPAGAWARILDPEDVVGIRFERAGASQLGTSEVVGHWLLDGLQAAGWPAEQIVLLEAPEPLANAYATRPYRFGWTAEAVDFGSGRDWLSSFYDQVTAVITVPFLKNDNLAGLSGCIKSLTYHMMKHPARFHDTPGLPFMADVLAVPGVRDKVRLCILNGLRVAYDKGPLVADDALENSGLIIMGTDPVATDAVGLHALSQIRQDHGLSSLTPGDDAPALVAAERKGLGYMDFRKIERRLKHVP